LPEWKRRNFYCFFIALWMSQNAIASAIVFVNDAMAEKNFLILNLLRLTSGWGRRADGAPNRQSRFRI